MAGIALRKTEVGILTVLKWMLCATMAILKLMCMGAKLFLLLLAMAIRVLLSLAGIASGSGISGH